MPDRTPCPYCHRVGFVRMEHVIKAGKAFIAFYCGSCNRSWEVAEGEDAARRDGGTAWKRSDGGEPSQ